MLLFAAAEIHSRFSAMRTTYRQNVNRIKSSTSGSATDDVYVPTWPHFESLKFLDASEPTRATETSYTVQQDENAMFTDFEYLDEDISTSSQNASKSINSSKSKSQPPKSKKAREEEVMDECLTVLKTVARDKANSENIVPIDRCQHFGNFVASSLREMTPWYRSCAMTEVSKILFKYDNNNPDADN